MSTRETPNLAIKNLHVTRQVQNESFSKNGMKNSRSTTTCNKKFLKKFPPSFQITKIQSNFIFRRIAANSTLRDSLVPIFLGTGIYFSLITVLCWLKLDQRSEKPTRIDCKDYLDLSQMKMLSILQRF